MTRVRGGGSRFQNIYNKGGAQFYGQSRQGVHGVCHGILIGSETPTTPKQFHSPLFKKMYLGKNTVKTEV